MAGMEMSLSNPSQAVQHVLTCKAGEIAWAEDVTYIYKRIEEIYAEMGPKTDLAKPVQALASEVKVTEQYLSLSVAKHLAQQHAYSPYYVVRLAGLLDTILPQLRTCLESNNIDTSRALSHSTAELQALANEYGFCTTMDAILDLSEASKKLDALANKLTALESGKNSPNETISSLQTLCADGRGIREAITEHNYRKLESKFDDLKARIQRVENDFSSEHMKVDGTLVMEYLAHLHLLHQPFVDTIIASDTFDVINSHMIHPGTRGWVLDMFTRWKSKQDKRIFFLAGKQGTGKTALSSAICKLCNYNVVANHFFDASQGDDVMRNKLNGLVQSLAADLCGTVPEYVNWLDDKYSSGNGLSQRLNTWRDSYNALFREPLQSLYGHGKTAKPNLPPRVLLVDGVDEMNRSDWSEFVEFQRSFIADLPISFKLFFTMRVRHMNEFVLNGVDSVEGIRLEDRAIANKHIKDIEIYLSSSLGAILSGEDELASPKHAKADEMTLQNTVDELLKCSAGRFDYALSVMASFAQEFSSSGQFLSSVKKATQPVRQSGGPEYQQRINDFASPYRAYRDKEGRSVEVRVMRQSEYLMDKTRVALIRGRHQQNLSS